MLRVKKVDTNWVQASQMENGDVAVIREWAAGAYIGQVVQRYGNHLITLGADSEKGWDEYFSRPSNHKNLIEILSYGTEFILEP